MDLIVPTDSVIAVICDMLRDNQKIYKKDVVEKIKRISTDAAYATLGDVRDQYKFPYTESDAGYTEWDVAEITYNKLFR